MRYGRGHRDLHTSPYVAAMIAVDRARVLIGWNRSANSETRWYGNASRQRNEVGMEIRAVASARVARVKRVAAAPACPCFVVTHSADNVIIERFGSFEIV